MPSAPDMIDHVTIVSMMSRMSGVLPFDPQGLVGRLARNWRAHPVGNRAVLPVNRARAFGIGAFRTLARREVNGYIGRFAVVIGNSFGFCLRAGKLAWEIGLASPSIIVYSTIYMLSQMPPAADKSQAKKRGAPATGIGRPIMVRAKDDWLEAVDTWRANQRPILGRGEAIRRLTSLGLKAEKRGR